VRGSRHFAVLAPAADSFDRTEVRYGHPGLPQELVKRKLSLDETLDETIEMQSRLPAISTFGITA
jgi:hypothetical protein